MAFDDHDDLYISTASRYSYYSRINSENLILKLTDKHDDNPNYPWHNHINTSTINGVLYLETIPKHGIKFKYDNKITYKEVKPYDLLIFPNFLDHVPIISKLKRRISLNFELNCVEKSEEIFGI